MLSPLTQAPSSIEPKSTSLTSRLAYNNGFGFLHDLCSTNISHHATPQRAATL